MKLSTWDAVLFDLDGTLADTVPLILAAYRHTMEVHRGGPRPDELWLAHVGRPLRETLREFAESEDEAAAMRETYVGFQRTVHDQMVRPFPGVNELVDGLRGVGTPMALVTSKAREMALRTLDVCGLADAFPVVITADEVTRGKPDPQPVHMALDQLGIGAGGTVFVGDSPHDVVAGRAAGVRTIGVTWGAAPVAALSGSEPDFLIRNVSDLGGIGPG